MARASDAEAAIRRVNAIHAVVRGNVPETGAAYHATDPALLLWVHATLVDTALRVYDRYVAPLTADEQQAYHAEARQVAIRMGIPESSVPVTLAELRAEMARMMADGTVRVDATARALAPACSLPEAFPAARGVGHGAPHLLLGAAPADPARVWHFLVAGARRRDAAPGRGVAPRGHPAAGRCCAACHRHDAPNEGSPAEPLGDGAVRRRYHAGGAPDRRVATCAAPQTMVPARPSPEDSLTRFAKLAIAAAAATFVLITVGGLVRATDSGLGCPDWPLCFGDWVPPAELHAWIEHSHRLVAAVLVGPLVGAVALITVFTARRRDRALLIAAVGAGVLVIVQALLGGQVVIQQLRRELVTAHLGMALTLLALTILIADRAVHGPMPGRRSALPVGLIGLTTVGRLRADAARLVGDRPRRRPRLSGLPADERQPAAGGRCPDAGHPGRASGAGGGGGRRWWSGRRRSSGVVPRAGCRERWRPWRWGW